MLQPLDNPVLWCGLIAGAIAQTIKLPLDYLQTRVWHWHLIFEAGGMPSSHSAFIVAISHGIGLFTGFNTPLYALGFAVTAIVVYDATGIRRQAGIHAELINIIIRNLATGHPLRIKDLQLREVLGHTPLEALAGVLLGLAVAQTVWLLWV
jgi:acid phosphatase family membrane protein YuiD